MIEHANKGHISDLVGFSGFYIGAEVSAIGDIKSEEDVFVDGSYKGSIKTTGAVEIGKNAKITGSIEARSAIIEGQLKGSVLALDNVYIAGCGELSGSAEGKSVSIDSGALVKARIDSGKNV
ncbi:MAG: polymer-forming cytoskeletal protein [bacterium]|jgi:cytoskeletal protein CcmA (bactofilin family)